ncbi:zinc finger protein CONSTANS-LIKE 16-like [Actinidia eriantha]|uniref:zinc finger protein CONSTANS-LIKE 16-like n=1 Tax=Actinidia eriantha TaxID=165200 RepID=UPI0025876E9C|nr:zinc finger protein CONSTANS-LIKE 16-like [Actinidia eriantha]
MGSNKKLANAIGSKTARACDGCIKKRARWFCAADDAFLCHSCDASIHSANPLARRHERVLLKTETSQDWHREESPMVNLVSSWDRGFTRRARTPRPGKKSIHRAGEGTRLNSHSHVPELGSGDTSNEDNEEQEQLVYRVPKFDQFVTGGDESKVLGLNRFFPSEMDIAEFDVESLLGKGLDGEESFGMESLGLLDWREKDSTSMEGFLGGGRIKVEDEVEMNSIINNQFDVTKELPFELDFDYEEEENCKVGGGRIIIEESGEGKKSGEVKMMKKRKILLRLDYEGVIMAWANQRSPWTSGGRPVLDTGECWPDCMGSCGRVHHPYGEVGLMGGHSAIGDGGREARVSRYREKRRTRLFSKKIRYEVRKLNAEKRPRMKGRFVKRASFAAAPANCLSFA